MIYIFIENGLYIDRYPISQKPCFDPKKSTSTPFGLQNPLLINLLFGIIPNSSWLLKTFLARVFSASVTLRRR